MMLNFDAAEEHFWHYQTAEDRAHRCKALVVMNDPQFVEASQVLAQNYAEKGQDDRRANRLCIHRVDGP